MPLLSEIPDRPFAIDLRIDLNEAARLRAPAAAWSLWPDAPFGASADAAVWPSVFVPSEMPAPDRISVDTAKAPFWLAFQLWDDIREMAHHLRPLKTDSTLIALALPKEHGFRLSPVNALGQLTQSTPSGETLAMDALLLGYDIVDEFLSSALFDAPPPTGIEVPAVSRSDYGLVASLDEAEQLIKPLETADPAHAPLVPVSVWSLGHRPASPDPSLPDQTRPGPAVS